jgi:hypothetical protein
MEWHTESKKKDLRQEVTEYFGSDRPSVMALTM